MKFKLKKNLIALGYAMIISLATAYASEMEPPKKNITGLVVTEDTEVVPGATVVLKDTKQGVITDIDGKFSIEAKEGQTLIISYLGYKTQEIIISKKDHYNIVLIEDLNNLEEVVVVGYGIQKKATLTGSVAAINNDAITTTKNENVQNMLTGKVAGLRVVQQSAEPGSYKMKFDIRGMGTPLIIIDGVPRDNIDRLDPNDIESISILKDASAAIYGVKAANGVVLVTTKSGGDTGGKPTLNYSSNFTWQYTSGMPQNVDAYNFMILSNEKGMNVANGGDWRFTQEEIDAYINGTKKSTNWFDAVIKRTAPQSQHNLNIEGGTKNTQYFIGLGYLYQDSFLRSGDLNYNKYNLRASISTKINKNLKIEAKISGIMDEKKAPAETARDIIYTLWRQYPTDPIYANDTYPYYYNPGQKDNPVPMMDSDVVGYENTYKKYFQSQIQLQYDAPFLEGLQLRAQVGYDYNQTTIKKYTKEYSYFTYNSALEEYAETVKVSPSKLRRTFSDKKSNLYQLSISYKHRFAKIHNVSALLLVEQQKIDADGFYAQRELSLDVDELFAGNVDNQIGTMSPSARYKYANRSYVGRLNYDFANKYMIEAAFRYDGSSRFSKAKRWGLFPSVSAGYRLSEETFWKKNNILSQIDNLKIRASYGVMGDDSALDYQFLTGYTYPSSYGYIFDGKYVNGVESTGIANNNITWYEAKTLNFGIDADAWNGLLGVSFDYFTRKRTGLLATSESVLPGTVGAELPQENLNSDCTRGFELELRHSNRIRNFRYNVSANISLTRSLIRYKQQAEYRNQYKNWKNNQKNRYKDIWWGLSGGSHYSSFQQIAEFPYHTSRSKIVGDWYYEDWNGDGFVDSNDEHPIGINSTPLLNYGINVSASYKGVDLNMLFQGAALANVAYTGQLAEPFWGGISAPLDIFLDRYRPVDPTADPYDEYTAWISGKYPMMGSSKADENSEANVHNSAYLRLKSIELGYSIPKCVVLNRLGIKSLRFYINAYNVLTFSKLDFVDPEHPSDSSGYMYPLNRTFSVGLNCQF